MDCRANGQIQFLGWREGSSGEFMAISAKDDNAYTVLRAELP
jgi:hypothetical protein